MFLSILAAASDTASDEKKSSGGSPIFTIVFMGLIFVAMYFFMIRPQRKRMREAQELQRSMEEGDEVVTNAGVYGFITAIDGDIIWLEIAENVEIRIARSAIARVVHASDAADTSATGTSGTVIDDIVTDDDN